MNTCPNCGKVAGLHSSILQGCMCQYSMQAPPQQEQEPVAHCEAGPEYCPVCNTELNQEPAIYPEEAYEMGLEEIAFYTAPPRRTWVGLTDEEIAQGCKESWVTEQAWQSAVWWAEAKLKEKNT
jgi:hypothetical protein